MRPDEPDPHAPAHTRHTVDASGGRAPRPDEFRDRVPRSDANSDRVPRPDSSRDRVPRPDANSDRVPRSDSNSDRVPRPGAPTPSRRLAGAPISWGVCEVPGWGRQLPPERVLGEMAGLGLTATELGPLGYLPLDADALRARLDAHGLALVGGFVPLVLHERTSTEALAAATRIAGHLNVAGAEVFVAAAVMDAGWSAPKPLDRTQLSHLAANLAEVAALVADHGLTFALHPHAGTLVESAADVERLLALTDVGWCLDTGHLLIGGCDPVGFVRDHGDRVTHVHLKDVDAVVASRYRTGELTLMGATQAGMFRPLGQGDASIAEVLAELDAQGYERWLVLEQDAAITGEEPPVGSGPVLDVQASVEFLASTAPRRERV